LPILGLRFPIYQIFLPAQAKSLRETKKMRRMPLDRFPHGWYNARAYGAQAGAENNPEAGTSPAAA
jgi:hypothetical protein